MSKNFSLALNLAALALGMLMLAYASVPLYRLFCDLTGYGGTPKISATGIMQPLARKMTVAFNADIDPNLPWDFKPGSASVEVPIGQQTLVYYVARNRANHPVKGRAVYNVLPFKAGAYFTKVECFCFEEQTLGPGESVNMPISFYIDPALAEDPNFSDLNTITLSYTFFEVKK